MVQAVWAHVLLVGPQEQAVLHSLLGWLQVLSSLQVLGSSLLLVLIRGSHSPHFGVGPEVFPQELFVSSSGSF